MLYTGLYRISNKTTKFKSQAGTSELDLEGLCTLTVGVRPYARTVYYWTGVDVGQRGKRLKMRTIWCPRGAMLPYSCFPFLPGCQRVCQPGDKFYEFSSPPPGPPARNRVCNYGKRRGALRKIAPRPFASVVRFPIFAFSRWRRPGPPGAGRVWRRQGMGHGRGLGGRL